MPIKFIIIELLCNLFGVQRYENMDTAHGAGWRKWAFGIANSAPPLFSKIWALWSDILTTYFHSNRCIMLGLSPLFYRFVY